MGNSFSLFEQIIFEADANDLPPDSDMASQNTPDIPDDANTGPPDIESNDINNDTIESDDFSSDDGPPDIPDEFDDMGGDYEDNMSDEETNNDDNNFGIDDKVSTILNTKLYQRYLTLLNNITNQINSITDNKDVITVISSDSLNVIDKLKELEENIRIYLNQYFMNENYAKNLLFFNKSINLLSLLNDSFGKNMKKGIKDMD